MSSSVITLDTTVAREKLAALAKVVAPAVVLRIIGFRLMSWVDESFKTRGRGQWAPLAWSTLALRRRGGDQPLQDTGRYRQSWVTETDQRTFVEVGSSLKTGSGLVLAKIHEEGTRPYTIRVRNAKVLAAQAGRGAGGAGQHGVLGAISSKRSSGWLFFGKEVHHPGVPPRPVLPTVVQAEQLVVKTVDAMLSGVAK